MHWALQLPQLLLSDEVSTHMSLHTFIPQLSQVPPLHQPPQHWPPLAQAPPRSTQAGSWLPSHSQVSKFRNSSPEQFDTQDVPHWVVPPGQPQIPWFGSEQLEPLGQQFAPQGTVPPAQTH